MKPAQPNQSLIDGLACLQTLAATDAPIGSREMARRLGLETTRVNRLLKTLAFLGLAQQDVRRKYVPGPGIHVLAAQAVHGSGLIRHALDPLTGLQGMDHQVAMGVLWRTDVCYLYLASPGDGADEAVGREPLYPAVESGLGTVLLAQLDDGEVRRLYTSELYQGEPVVLDGAGGLLSRLARVRRDGYAIVQGSASPRDHRTIAVTVGDPAIAAIGLAGRFEDGEASHLADLLHKTAAEIVRSIERR